MEGLILVTKLIDEKQNSSFIYLDPSREEYVISSTEITSVSDESKKENKVIRPTREKINKKLATIGVVLTLLCAEPKIVNGLDFVAKRTYNAVSCSDVSFNTTNLNFTDKLYKAIDSNNQYTEEEKEYLKPKFESFFNDWGYLLNETDKRYILNVFENIKVKRNAELPSWAAGDYAFKTVNISKNATINTFAHELGHAMSDHGLTIGTINGYGFGYALNEAINSSVTSKYLGGDLTYQNQRADLDKLFCLAGNTECFIKYYLTGDITDLVDSIISDCPGVTPLDIKRYISMMDLELFIDDYKVFKGISLPKNFYEEKEKLYKKMFSSKFPFLVSYDDNNVCGHFWESTVEFSYGLFRYKVPNEDIFNISYGDFDLTKYVFNYGNNSMKLLAGDYSFENFNADDFRQHISSRFDGDEELISKFFNCFSSKDSRANKEYFVELYLYIIDAKNLEPWVVASYLRDVLPNLNCEFYSQSEKAAMFYDSKMQEKEIVSKVCSSSIAYWYNNTDISFNTDFPSGFGDIYNEITNARYRIIDEKNAIICVDDGYSFKECYSKDSKYNYGDPFADISSSGYILKMSEEEVSDNVRNFFGNTNGSSFYILQSDEPIDFSTLTVLQSKPKEVTDEMKAAMVYSESAHK